jgi:hypothetical protein
MSDNVIQFPDRSKEYSTTPGDIKFAYARGIFGVLCMFGGAYFVGRGAMLIVLGVLLCIGFIATMLRRDIVTVAQEIERRAPQ